VELAFNAVELDWEDHVVIDPRFYRPAEVDILLGNPEKAKRELSWEARTSFKELVELMVKSDMELFKP
jgi:GDPmannose 4,6-dehydratase